MRRTKRNVLDDTDDEASAGSETPDSDSTNGSSRAVSKKKATPKKKRGRPCKTTDKKRQKLQDDSDDDRSSLPSTVQNASDNDSNSSDSNYTNGSSRVVSKKKATSKKKRGRPRKIVNKTTPRLQDDSDDDRSSQPTTIRNASDNDSNSSDSNYTANPKRNQPKRRPGRPPLAAANNKRQGFQIVSLRPASPQPSTSRNVNIQNAQESEDDSSNSADSDFGPFNERSLVKKKPPPGKRKLPPKSTSPKTAKKKPNTSVIGVSLQKLSLNPSQSNATPKKSAKLSQSHDTSMDSKQIESLAEKLVYFLLIEDQKKYAIRRKAIITHVFKDEDYSAKLYTAVIKKANIILKQTYGMELMELENQKDSYIVINILRHELSIHDYIDMSRLKQQQHGLILFLLTVIYMNENVISEDELIRSLKPLGIDLTAKKMHPIFGDIKKYISTELVKQMYLNYECISKDPPKYEYSWGLRAKQEFDKRDLLQFVCTIMDDTVPEDWRMQFRDAEASAKPETEKES